MRATLMKKLRSFRSDEEGVTLVEYGTALVLAVVVGTATLTGLAGDVQVSMDNACNVLQTNTATGAVGTAGC